MADYIQIKNGTTDVQPIGADTGSTTRYFRSADGTQICWGTITPAYANPNIAQATVNFTVAFSAYPCITATPYGAENAAQELSANVKIGGSCSTTGFTVTYHDPGGRFNSSGAYIKPIYWIAIGRWK